MALVFSSKQDDESETKQIAQRRDVIYSRDSGAICGLLLRNARLAVPWRRSLSAIIIIIHLIYRYIVHKVIRKIVHSILI